MGNGEHMPTDPSNSALLPLFDREYSTYDNAHSSILASLRISASNNLLQQLREQDGLVYLDSIRLVHESCATDNVPKGILTVLSVTNYLIQ